METEIKKAEWLNSFSEVEKIIISKLLDNFTSYDYRKSCYGAKLLFEKFREDYTDNLQGIIFVKTYKEMAVACSSAFFVNFWSINNLYNMSAQDDFFEKVHKNVEYLAIVDDYSGSGKTIEKTLKKGVESGIIGKNTIIYVLVLAVSEMAKKYIETIAVQNDLCVKIIYIKKTKKAFERNNIFGEDEYLRIKKDFIQISKNRGVKSDILGFEETEELLSFYYNTPNNTLGLFWKETDGNIPPFSRIKKEHTELKEIISETKNRNSNRMKRNENEDNEEMKLNYLLGLIYYEGLRVELICKKMGLTVEQFEYYIEILVKKGKIDINQKCQLIEEIDKERVQIWNNTKESNISMVFDSDVKHDPKNFANKFKGYKL